MDTFWEILQQLLVQFPIVALLAYFLYKKDIQHQKAMKNRVEDQKLIAEVYKELLDRYDETLEKIANQNEFVISILKHNDSSRKT